MHQSRSAQSRGASVGGLPPHAWGNRWQHGWRYGWPEGSGWPEGAGPRAPRSSPRLRLLVPVIISFIVQVPASLYWLVVGRDHSVPVIVSVVLAVLGPLLLLAARRFPGPVVAVLAVAASVDLVLSVMHPGPPYIALAFAIGGAVVRGARLWAWISVGTAWVVTLVGGFIVGLDWRPVQIAITTLGILIVFGLAEGMRTRREVYEEYRRDYTQRKQSEVQAERVRIARELHDVLAHSLSQINVQASVGLHLLDKQPEKASEALASIKETSKTALDEVRSVLGVLRAEDGHDPSAPLVPEPDLSRLTGLAASVTSQGVEVTLSNTLESAPQAVQLAIYRIVQEALTNVVRHSKANQASVDISEADGNYVIAIADNGVGLSDGRELTSGRGVLGMRERAELLGGSLEVGPGPLGGLLVMVAIPQKERA